MLKAFKYRLYPTNEQAILLNKHFGCVRFVYNWALAEKMKAYQSEGKTLSRFELDKQLTGKKKELDWMGEVNSQSLQAALRHLDAAYTRFFREKKGFPKFKKKVNRQSFECPQNVVADFENQTIKLPKIGRVKAVYSRQFVGSVKTVTVSKTPTGKFFASVLVETHTVAATPAKPDKSQSVGVDVGLKDFATLSTGEKISNPKYLKRSLKRIKNLQWRVSRKPKGTSNRNKARKRLAKQYERVTNQRNDFLHKVSTRLVRENQSICVENLNVAGMVKNRHLAQAISDVSWSKFVDMLRYKCEWRGKNLLQIGRFEPSSKLCTCGTLNKNLSLKDREWTCSVCGTTHDRDVLAANNIVQFAFLKQNLVPSDRGEITLGETVAVVTSANQESPRL